MIKPPFKPANLLNANSFGNDILHPILRWLLHQVAVQQAGKVTVQALRDKINTHVKTACNTEIKVQHHEMVNRVDEGTKTARPDIHAVKTICKNEEQKTEYCIRGSAKLEAGLVH